MRAFSSHAEHQLQQLVRSATKPAMAAGEWRKSRHPILDLQRTIGNQAVLRALQSDLNGIDVVDATAPARFNRSCSRPAMGERAPISVQSKLTVSSPADTCEQAAERVAEQVMRMAEPGAGALATPASSSLQRKCAECEKEEEQKKLARKGAHSAAVPDETSASAVVYEGLRSPGKPLDPATQGFFEARFGQDFSQVRVHSDWSAARSASLLGAQAFTTGQDVFLAEGQYAPATDAGKRLLAHELAHVVQQRSSDADPLIRRRLLVTSDPGDIKAFFGLLEPASGLKLKADPIKGDPKTKQVTGKPSVSTPPSPTLANELKAIMEDPQQDAELSLGRTQAGVLVGSFSLGELRFAPEEGKPEHLVQEIRIDQLVALEKGAPGSGVESLVHEMTENFHAHSPTLLKNVRKGPMSAEEAFEESHREAIKEEELVIGELKHPGKRHGLFKVLSGKEPHQFFRVIQDMEQYFLVWESAFGGSGGFSHVRRVPPIQVSAYEVKGYDAAPTSGKKSRQLSDIIDQASADLKDNPTASSRIKVLVSVFDVPNPTPDLPQKWAERIQDTVEAELQAITPELERALEPRSDAEGEWTSDEQSSVKITVNRPDIP